MRSERKLDQVLSPKHWEAVYAWMDGLKNIDHLVIMSSIPVVYPGFETLERILGWWPGQNELEDDLADHWKIGRASCRERVCQYVETSVVAESLTKKSYNDYELNEDLLHAKKHDKINTRD